MAQIYAKQTIADYFRKIIAGTRNVQFHASQYLTLYAGQNVPSNIFERLDDNLRAAESQFLDGWDGANGASAMGAVLNLWIAEMELDAIGADPAARRQALRDGKQDFMSALNAVQATLRALLRQNRKSREYDGSNNPIPVLVLNADLAQLETDLNALTSLIEI